MPRRSDSLAFLLGFARFLLLFGLLAIAYLFIRLDYLGRHTGLGIRTDLSTWLFHATHAAMFLFMTVAVLLGFSLLFWAVVLRKAEPPE